MVAEWRCVRNCNNLELLFGVELKCQRTCAVAFEVEVRGSSRHGPPPPSWKFSKTERSDRCPCHRVRPPRHQELDPKYSLRLLLPSKRIITRPGELFLSSVVFSTTRMGIYREGIKALLEPTQNLSSLPTDPGPSLKNSPRQHLNAEAVANTCSSSCKTT